ncbi:MAG: peptidase [Akkermansiaceae bacterium]|nr:peptidase [Akkermansiaceae bacterium]
MNRILLHNIALATALLSNSCITRRATDFLTIPNRAVDGAHWEKEAGVHPQRFTVVASDGIQLSCLILEANPAVKKRGTAYLFHGLGNSKEQMLPTARRLSDAGFRCVAWDSRGHGKSGGVRISYGIREVDDARRVIAEGRKRDHGRRGTEVIWAYSMGTAVALQTLPYLPEVKAAVLLAPIADLGGVIRYQASANYHGSLTPLLPLVRADIRSTAGFDPNQVRPVDALRLTKCKLLLVHGGQDRVIPPSQSQKLLDASAPGQSRRVLIPGFLHHQVMWELPEKTQAEAVQFLVDESKPRWLR